MRFSIAFAERLDFSILSTAPNADGSSAPHRLSARLYARAIKKPDDRSRGATWAPGDDGEGEARASREVAALLAGHGRRRGKRLRDGEATRLLMAGLMTRDDSRDGRAARERPFEYRCRDAFPTRFRAASILGPRRNADKPSALHALSRTWRQNFADFRRARADLLEDFRDDRVCRDIDAGAEPAYYLAFYTDAHGVRDVIRRTAFISRNAICAVYYHAYAASLYKMRYLRFVSAAEWQQAAIGDLLVPASLAIISPMVAAGSIGGR